MFVIDLSGLPANYGGGLRTFSIDLSNAIIKIHGNSVVIVGSDKLHKTLKNYPELCSVKWIKYDQKIYILYQKILSFISIICYLIGNPYFLKLIKSIVGRIFFKVDNNSIIISTNSTLSFYKKKCKTILCIHDIQHEIYPKNFSKISLFSRFWRYRVSAEMSSLIQVSSKAIAEDINQKMSNCKNKIFLAPEGFNKKKFNYSTKDKSPSILENFKLPKTYRFIFYPAQFWKHKNHINLIKSIALIQNEYNLSNIYLFCSGKDYGTLEDCIQLSKNLKVNFLHLGFINIKELIWCYRNCISTISSSYHESSCLTLKEAVACGTNSLSFSNIDANQDLFNFPNTYIFNPFDPKDIAVNLKKAINLKHSFLREKGWDLIKEYEWENIYIKNYLPVIL